MNDPRSGWIEDPTTPSGWSWTPDLAASPESVSYGGHTDHRGPADTVDVPPRPDGWCEDRGPDDLSDDDGID